MAKYDKDGFGSWGSHRIHVAAWEGDLEAILKELDAGVSVDVETRAPDAGKSPLYFAAYANQPEAMKFLIERKANIDKPDVDGWTPLISASIYGREQAIGLLQ